ncbi:hypothetical protein EDD27_10490 [Nonomuraea polychroma]|uniref:Secreted protein n=1 Tax=Nonomuraea polychroma TaxID=46176 RepID=A0A438MP17_9ACTN|nr:hypothetical protein [Nonomuraea polychroma]RVX47553.1 hypothetical protein EDD27_10490 [Nonomuraea polychroma]
MRRTIALAVSAASSIALAGCGMLPGQQGGGGEERQSQAVSDKQATPAPKEAQEQQTAPAQQDQVIAGRETKVGAGGTFGKARVEITALKRQGRTVSLNWTVTATDGKVNVHNGLGTAALDFTVSGVSLIDPVNAKRYRVARNGTGEDAECVCSGTQGQFLEEGQASTLYAVFAAPPPDVTKVNVEMPMFGVFTDVPIS